MLIQGVSTSIFPDPAKNHARLGPKPSLYFLIAKEEEGGDTRTAFPGSFPKTQSSRIAPLLRNLRLSREAQPFPPEPLSLQSARNRHTGRVFPKALEVWSEPDSRNYR
jgi:hypothetical protein